MSNLLQQALRWLLALSLAANAIFMLNAPRLWYDTIPGVVFTGSFNEHFVRDIGCAYMISAVGLAWRALSSAGWPAALSAALFLLMHGAVHVLDLAQGRCTASGFLRDAPAVILPGLVALWLAWSERAEASRRDLHPGGQPLAKPVSVGWGAPVKWLLHSFISRFEQRFGYNMGYAHELLDTSVRAFLHYALMGLPAAYRRDVPKEAWYAVKIVAARAEDCGPCLQLVMNMAETDGVPASVRRAVWTRDQAQMSDDVRLAWRYAEAALAHAADLSDLCAAVEGRWGRRGLHSLALSMTASRSFPLLKYALGHGQHCQAICIDGQILPNPAIDSWSSAAFTT
jgi:hypothetical protein